MNEIVALKATATGLLKQDLYARAKSQLIHFLGGDWTPNQTELEGIKVRLGMEKTENRKDKAVIKGKTNNENKTRYYRKKGKLERDFFNIILLRKHLGTNTYYIITWQAQDIFDGYVTAATTEIPTTENPEIDEARIHLRATTMLEDDLNPLLRSNRVVRGIIWATTRDRRKSI